MSKLTDDAPDERTPSPERQFIHGRLDIWLYARDALKGSDTEYGPSDVVELAEFLAGDNIRNDD